MLNLFLFVVMCLFVVILGSEQYRVIDPSQLLRRSVMLERELMEQQARETQKDEVLDFSLDFQVFIL
jgi:hypothetical protein